MTVATSVDPIRPELGATQADFPLTDQGNAERLVAAHGRELRYAPGVGWLAWDGRRWRRDEDGEVQRRAKSTVRELYRIAGTLDDDSARQALAAHARRSESEPRLRALVTLAQTEAELVVEVSDLDADPDLLNVENGIVNLLTGVLMPHEPEHLITRLAPAVFDPNASTGFWQVWLEQMTGGDHALQAFIQRAVGYTITGHTSEEVLFFLHGPTASGKSTALEALKAMLGDYARTIDFEALVAKRDAGMRNDIARLAGARLVIGSEVDQGKRIAEALLKQITGGDTVTARFMYRDYFEFTPAFKLWLAANHRPKLSAQDDAIWRRILQIPFTTTIEASRRDPHIKQSLVRDQLVRSQILAWATQGAIAWREHGLSVPDTVVRYTAAYRAEVDPLTDWLDACCHADPDLSSSSSNLRDSYEAFAEANGDRPLTRKAFGIALASHDFESRRGTGGVRQWRGIALRPPGSDT